MKESYSENSVEDVIENLGEKYGEGPESPEEMIEYSKQLRYIREEIEGKPLKQRAEALKALDPDNGKIDPEAALDALEGKK